MPAAKRSTTIQNPAQVICPRIMPRKNGRNARYNLTPPYLSSEALIIEPKKILNQALDEHDAHANFEVALRRATYLLAFSFFLSATLNYILAKVLLVSPPGTPEYSAELGKMTGLSFPVIALPCTVVMMAALFYLMRRVRQLTALELEQIFRLHQE